MVCVGDFGGCLWLGGFVACLRWFGVVVVCVAVVCGCRFAVFWWCWLLSVFWLVCLDGAACCGLILVLLWLIFGAGLVAFALRFMCCLILEFCCGCECLVLWLLLMIASGFW